MKSGLSERDICTKYITPTIQSAGWDNSPPTRDALKRELIDSLGGSN